MIVHRIHASTMARRLFSGRSLSVSTIFARRDSRRAGVFWARVCLGLFPSSSNSELYEPSDSSQFPAATVWPVPVRFPVVS